MIAFVKNLQLNPLIFAPYIYPPDICTWINNELLCSIAKALLAAPKTWMLSTIVRKKKRVDQSQQW